MAYYYVIITGSVINLVIPSPVTLTEAANIANDISADMIVFAVISDPSF